MQVFNAPLVLSLPSREQQSGIYHFPRNNLESVTTAAHRLTQAGTPLTKETFRAFLEVFFERFPLLTTEPTQHLTCPGEVQILLLIWQPGKRIFSRLFFLILLAFPSFFFPQPFLYLFLPPSTMKQRIKCETWMLILSIAMQNIINQKFEVDYRRSNQTKGCGFLAHTGSQNPAENK